MVKKLRETAQLLQKISRGAAVNREWDNYQSGAREQGNQGHILAGIFRKEL